MLDTIATAGLRRATTAGLHASALADTFTGLPEGVSRWRLAAALRAAARPMGLTGPMLRLLEHYIDLSYDQDWEPGAEPVITRPLVEIAEHLGRTERQIRNIERALVEKGLLAWRDSGNHHRKGRRDRRSGQLVYAFGPTLAPMGARAAEIIAAAAAAREQANVTRRLRIATSALRRRIRAAIATATEDATLDDDVTSAIHVIKTQFDALPSRDRAGLDPAALAARRDAMMALAQEAELLLHGPTASLEPAIVSAKPEISTDSNTNTTTKNTINGESIPSERELTENTDANDRRASELNAIPLALAVAAAGPILRMALEQRGKPSWATLVEAAQEIIPMMGIDAALWRQTCGALGRYRAALAILVIERSASRSAHGVIEPVRRPDAYLRGMMARHYDGALHLDRSLRGWAARPDRQTFTHHAACPHKSVAPAAVAARQAPSRKAGQLARP